MTTRRSMIAGTAAALAGGVATNLAAITLAKAETAESFSGVSDPIFAAIERHLALYNEIESLNCQSKEEEETRLDPAVQKLNRLHDDILAATPATAAGIAAQIRFLIEFELEPYDYTEHGGDFLRRLAASLDEQVRS